MDDVDDWSMANAIHVIDHLKALRVYTPKPHFLDEFIRHSYSHFLRTLKREGVIDDYVIQRACKGVSMMSLGKYKIYAEAGTIFQPFILINTTSTSFLWKWGVDG